MWLFKWILQLRDMSNCLGLYASHCQFSTSPVLSNHCLPSFSCNTKIKSNCCLTHKNSTRQSLLWVVPHVHCGSWPSYSSTLMDKHCERVTQIYKGAPSFPEHVFVYKWCNCILRNLFSSLRIHIRNGIQIWPTIYIKNIWKNLNEFVGVLREQY